MRQHHPFASEPFVVEADQYEIRVRGTMGDAVLERFEEFEVEVEPVETVLRGPIRDQAELHGLLARIESLGLELVEIKQTEGRTRRAIPRSSERVDTTG